MLNYIVNNSQIKLQVNAEPPKRGLISNIYILLFVISNLKSIQKRKNNESDSESDYKPKTSQKHYTKEEKEKLKRKIELLELKKAKKLGKPIEEVRAERNQTSVRFNELIRKVEKLQDQVEELQYQLKKLSRR